MREAIDPKPSRSSHNLKALPERTVREVKLFEFGSVTFPGLRRARRRSLRIAVHLVPSLGGHSALCSRKVLA
jgi:hypothetical protein